MKLQITLLVPAIILTAASIWNAASTEPHVSSNAVSTARISNAMGCDITIKAENTGTRDLYIILEQSQVRSKQLLVAGSWSTLDTKCPKDEMHLEAHASTESTTCELALICDLKRQYKFLIQEKSNGRIINTAWVYYPSNDDWAEGGTRTINLGNIGRHF